MTMKLKKSENKNNMKNILRFVPVVLAAGILLTSCQFDETIEPDMVNYKSNIKTIQLHAGLVPMNMREIVHPKKKPPANPYKFPRVKMLFAVPEKITMQGLAYANNVYYISFDMGKGMGRIDAVDSRGRILTKTENLPIEHAAEIAYRKANKSIYVANGVANDHIRVYRVDMNSRHPSVAEKITPNVPGYGGLLAVDNDHDSMIISTNKIPIDIRGNMKINKNAALSFYVCDFKGKMKKRFTIPYQGVPQGMEYYKNNIYFYTNNKVTVVNMSGKILSYLHIAEPGESEGMTLSNVSGCPVFAVGYSYKNRVYVFKADGNYFSQPKKAVRA